MDKTSRLSLERETRISSDTHAARIFNQHLKAYEFVCLHHAGRRILEIGFGDGYGLYYLADKCNADLLVGIDYDPQQPLGAQKKYPAKNLYYLSMDALNLGFRPTRFSTILAFQLIEHLPVERLHPFLQSIYDLLEEKGRFYLSTLNLTTSKKNKNTYQKNPAHQKEFQPDELLSFLRGVFPFVEMFGLHPSPTHKFWQRIKKIGIFRFLPRPLNPVMQFYEHIRLKDFRYLASTEHSLDLLCICKKE